jgi:hypothetical protein
MVATNNIKDHIKNALDIRAAMTLVESEHYENCETEHIGCLLRSSLQQIEALEKELALLEHQVAWSNSRVYDH